MGQHYYQDIRHPPVHQLYSTFYSRALRGLVTLTVDLFVKWYRGFQILLLPQYTIPTTQYVFSISPTTQYDVLVTLILAIKII